MKMKKILQRSPRLNFFKSPVKDLERQNLRVTLIMLMSLQKMKALSHENLKEELPLKNQ
jgi:hypothetical protein